MTYPLACRFPVIQRDVEALRTYLSGVFEHHYKTATLLLLRQRTPQDGFLLPSEAEDMKTFLATTQGVACRLYWQLGYLGLAGAIPATVAAQRGHLSALHDQMAARPGMDPNSPKLQAYVESIQSVGDIEAWNAVCAVLAETSEATRKAAAPGSRNQTGRTRGSRTAERSRAQAHTHLSKVEVDALQIFTENELVGYARDPLFDRFSGWVDQLVSQVVGRAVTLSMFVDSAEAVPYPTGPLSGYVQVHLVEADGRKVPFSWGAGRGGSSTSSSSSSSRAGSSLPWSSGPPFDSLTAERNYTMGVYMQYLLPQAAAAVPGVQAEAATGAVKGTVPTGSSRGGSGAEAAATSSRGSGGTAPKKGFSFKAALGASSAAAGTSQAAGGGGRQASGNSNTRISSSSGGSSSGGTTRGLEALQDLAKHHGFNVAKVTNLHGLSLQEMEKKVYQHISQVSEGANGDGGSGQGPGRHAGAASNTGRPTAGVASSSTGGAPTATRGAGSVPPSAVQSGGDAAGRGPASHPIAAAAESSAEAAGSRKEPRPCAICGQLFTKLQRCSKCKQVLYCSKEHQVEHWKLVHRQECQGQP
jgi:hypothetical protein